jgi:hypothetical protein
MAIRQLTQREQEREILRCTSSLPCSRIPQVVIVLAYVRVSNPGMTLKRWSVAVTLGHGSLTEWPSQRS